jgi:carboxyl-terminal processing protease
VSVILKLPVKKQFCWTLLALAMAGHALGAEAVAVKPPVLGPQPQQATAANMSAYFLTRYHYKGVPLDDAMSEKIFNRYLKSLDSEKLFFTQPDVDQFSTLRTRLDDAILNGDLSQPFAMFNLYEQRVAQRLSQARELLKTEPDFTLQEDYVFNRDKAKWATSEQELQDLWRRRVKNDWLRLKLAGQDAKAIRATLDKRYATYLTSLQKLKSEDAFQTFLDAYASSVEPHTNYLGPRASENFDISMKLSLEGIGAVLQERDEYITIRELMAGGPAMLSEQLKVGDRILGVGQGDKGPVTDVMGWRIDDAVNLIRGAKGSKVALDVLPADASPDGKHKLVVLTRQKISLENQAAKKSVLEVKQASAMCRVGVISLPSFYEDFEARRRGDADYKSASRDVSRLLAELKSEKVDGVVVDLRNNGGGSLNEAVNLTGLFVDKGPAVQQRNSRGQINVYSIASGASAWNGPMGVLVNRGSASASEIFAAAIQDYGRGVIIGEPSFGKGTVQTIVDLAEAANLPAGKKDKLGELKMTIAQFFRINGGATQLRGVAPDIALPSASDAEKFGESSYDNALPWTQIKPAEYTPTGDLADLLPMLQVRHDSRVAQDKDYRALLEDIAEFNTQRKKNQISLNEAERRKERDRQEARAKAREERTSKATAAQLAASAGIKRQQQDDGLQGNERSLAEELAAEKARKDAKDVLLAETSQVMCDEVNLLKTNSKLAARVLPALRGNALGTGAN